MIPPETSPFEALAYAAKRLLPKKATKSLFSKIGFWRPIIVAVLGYQEWDKREVNHRHERRIDRVESAVTAPPTDPDRFPGVIVDPTHPDNR